MSENNIKAEEPKKNKKKSNKGKYAVSIIVMVLVTVLALYYVLSQDTDQIFAALGNAKAIYIFLMIGIVLLAFCIEGVVLTILTKFYKSSFKVYQGVLNGLIGSFFSNITPFASGGQFVQAYTFSKQGVKPADAASILVMAFIVSQIVIVLYGTLAMIFGYSSTICKMTNIVIGSWSFSPIAFSIIGYVINICSLGILFLLSYCRPIHRFVLNTVIGIGGKLHLIRDPEHKKTALAAQVATFRIELSRLFKNYWALLITLVLEFLKFTCYNSLPFFAGLALGEDMHGLFLKCLWSNSYLNMITTFIPLPGASGGSEAGFQILFKSIFSSDAITSAANIITRAISFYFSLIVGFFVFVFYRGSPKKQVINYDNKKTFVDLQIVSFANNNPQFTGEVPSLREVTIVPFDDKDGVTQTSEISPSQVKEKMNDESSEIPLEHKKKKIWPWSKKNSVKPTVEDTFLTSEEVEKSFNKIKQTLIFNQENIYKDEDAVAAKSKKYLASAYSDVAKKEEIQKEENKTDTEIELAIKKDLDALKAEQDKKNKKAKAKADRRLARKQRREEKRRLKEEKKK